MGMFDTVHCKYPLQPEHQNLEFQTKDLDCVLDTYCITEDGRLFRKHTLGRENEPEVEVEHHGDISIYDIFKQDENGNGEWIKYKVRFTHGKVESVTQVMGDDPVGRNLTIAQKYRAAVEIERIVREKEKTRKGDSGDTAVPV